MSKIKQCPFCGGQPTITNSVQDISIGVEHIEDYGFLGLCSRTVKTHPHPKYVATFYISCCGAEYEGQSESEVIQKWNDRRKKRRPRPTPEPTSGCFIRSTLKEK